MKITETTKPVERTFTIELTENQLKNLGLALGTTMPSRLARMIKEGDFIEDFRDTVYEDCGLYEKIIDIFKVNK